MSAIIDVSVGVGELIDKITILEIKSQRLVDSAKLANVRAELDLLRSRRDAALPQSKELDGLASRLFEINLRLWELEDTIRACDLRQDFGPAFIETARGIYQTNDERAAVKRKINLAFGSAIVEEKSYRGL